MSQNNADQPARPLVDDLLQGLTHLLPGVLGHVLELGGQVLVDELMERPAEDVGLPDPLRLPLELLEEEASISSDCFSLPTMGETSAWISARIMWMLGALARRRTP